jgi:hypothetical protein
VLVAFTRGAYLDSVDQNGEVVPADGLSGNCQNVLDEGNAERQVVAVGKEVRKRTLGHGDDQVSYSEPVGWLQAIESDRNALGSVPDKQWSWFGVDHGCHNHRCANGHNYRSRSASHGMSLLRWSHAWCRLRVYGRGSSRTRSRL